MKKENKIRSLFLKAKSCKLQAGFSLVEMLFYVMLLSLCLVIVTQTLVVVTRSFGVLRTAQRIEQGASLSLERMLREIRDANGINDAGSTFGAHPGKLYLASTNSAGTARTVEFYLSNGQLMLREDGSATGALTGANVTISNLVFRKISTVRSKGVKIEVTLQSGAGQSARSETFYTTAVLRDSY